MRTWEAALAAFTIAIILSRMAGLHGRFFALAAAAGIAALTAVHAAVEGWRWQMYPLYGAAALALIAALAGSYARPLRLRARIAAGFPVTALACCGAAAAVLLPVFRVPPPAGPYAVGTMLFQAVDDNREEFFTESPDDKREIAIQVWYPAAPETQGPGAPWLERLDLYGAVLSAQVGMPTFFFDHVVHVRTNAVEGAPVAEGDPFPVVIYSHGWTAWRGINTDQVENLASHGYVVIVPEHAYGANLSILPDGRPIYNLPSIVPDRKDVGDEAYFTSIRRLVDAYAGDIRFCLDKAAEWHGAGAATPFGGKLDLDRIGVFGHSTGGGAVAEVMAEDPRIKAACAMDLWALPVSDDLLEAPKDTPFLGLESAVWSSEENTARIDRFLESLNGPA